MKHYLFLVASAALVLASCSSEEPVEVNNGRAIGFRSHISRASEMSTPYLQDFNATALYPDGSTYFQDVTFSKGANGVFNSVKPIYWPSVNSLDFIAYSPCTLTGGTLVNDETAKTNMLTDFSPATYFADQYDFISTPVVRADRSSAEADGVGLTFYHRLSQIEIRAKSSNEDFTFKVKGVKIGDVANLSTFNFKTSSWTEPTGRTSYSAEWPTANVIALNSKDQTLMVAGGNAMLLPQTTTAWKPNHTETPTGGHAAEGGSYISVLLQITDKNNKLIYPFDTQKDTNGQVKEYAWAAVPVAFIWEQGNKYIYTLDFTYGAGYVDKEEPNNPDEPILQPIRFTVNVQPWNGPTSIDTPMQNVGGSGSEEEEEEEE